MPVAQKAQPATLPPVGSYITDGARLAEIVRHETNGDQVVRDVNAPVIEDPEMFTFTVTLREWTDTWLTLDEWEARRGSS